ncbi:MAG TPA: adenylate/guanylate cyclase domain-containing protein [Solirubrobacterales bacterium]|nr:adenylate/guanylate cyclase domain-containing protein [Solirubrobacterales bacterium]
MATDEPISLTEAERRSGVPASTLRRWASQRIVAIDEGWTAAAASQARVVARMRDRGHSLREIRAAVRDGRLAFGSIEELLPSPHRRHTRAAAAEMVGLEAELIERVMTLLGTPMEQTGRISDEDVAALRRMAGALENGFPLIALLQLVRVYTQAGRRIAEAEVRLFHLFVHEPMIRDGVPPLEMAADMERMASELLPTVAPVLEYIHRRYIRFYMEQDVVGHMEADLPLTRSHPDRVSMAFCFVDLTGFTRFTEEEGDETALDIVEQFTEAVEATLPADATIVKTIGDEVMIVSSEPRMLAEWAVGLLTMFDERPRPRVAIHWGDAVYRDGDYFGGDVNLAHRVVTRALAGEVLVTRAVVEAIGESPHLDLEPIGEVALKGLPDPTDLYLATARNMRSR